MRALLIVVALIWAWLHTTWHHVDTENADREDVAKLSHRLLAAGLTVPGGGTPGSSGSDGNPSIFGKAAWAMPEELLAVRGALREGRLVVIRQFLDHDAARTLRNEVGRLFAARGNWTEFANGNLSMLNRTAFEESFHAGSNCSHMSRRVQLAGAFGSRPLIRHQEHALPGSLGSIAMAQVVGRTSPMLASLNRIMRSEEMSQLVAWLFDMAGDHSQESIDVGPVTWELKVTRWRPKIHWAAPHEDSVRPRGGPVGARRFAAFTFQLCDNHEANEGQGGAFIWCAPHTLVPCAFNQLVFFSLRSGAMHAVEPVFPNWDGGQASSRWTLQAWASARGDLKPSSDDRPNEYTLPKYAADLLDHLKRYRLAWWNALAHTTSAVPQDVLEPHFVNT